MKRGSTAVPLAFLLVCSALAMPQAATEVTIEPETRAMLVLQTPLSTKLSEPGDPITAVLNEPLSVNGQLALPRGTEFLGRVLEVKPARRGMKNGQIAIIFDRVAMPWGEEPVAVALTAMDDYASDEKHKADDEGKVKGKRDGRNTAENVVLGGAIGSAGGSAIVLMSGGGYGAAGGAIAGGLLGGLLFSKGGDVRVQPGTMLRIKFVKPFTIPVSGRPARPDTSNPPDN